MKVLLAADGSEFTRKAMQFLVLNPELFSGGGELLVMNVQPTVHGPVITMLGSADVALFHAEEFAKVLDPVEQFLGENNIKYRCLKVVGAAVDEIIATAEREQASMIVMGTQGLGWLGRALLGSVAQRVVTGTYIPVLLVK